MCEAKDGYGDEGEKKQKTKKKQQQKLKNNNSISSRMYAH